MAVQLRPGNSNLLRTGSYKFTMEEVQLIHKLYTTYKYTLWAIKEINFNEAQIEQIAVAVTHGKMDIEQIPYDQRPTFSYDPSSIIVSEFRVGHPSQ